MRNECAGRRVCALNRIVTAACVPGFSCCTIPHAILFSQQEIALAADEKLEQLSCVTLDGANDAAPLDHDWNAKATIVAKEKEGMRMARYEQSLPAFCQDKLMLSS